MTTTTDKKALKEGAIYFSDNGRTICHKCAGMSALYTGRDISGQKVERLTSVDVAWLVQEEIPASCERGCTTLSAIAGPDGWPAAV